MAAPNLHMYSMPELLDRLGLDYEYRNETTARMRCPFCKREKVRINIDLTKDAWRCPACGKSGYTINFFSLYYLQSELYPTSSRSEVKETAKKLRAYMEGPGSTTSTPHDEPRPTKASIPVASDDQLDAVYTAMSKIPAIQLLPKHRDNLLKRGLSDEAIARNGYRSIPEKMTTIPYYHDMYNNAGGETRRTADSSLKKLSSQQIRFGMMIAHSIISQGLSVEGVPGFYRFGNAWSFWCTPGIMIPTRNIKGQIVIWQVRRDKLRHKNDQRYFTVSYQTLPGHVNGRVSRCHFPLGNAPLSKEVPFLVTEGPLKADVACHLYSTPVTFVSIPGIQSTSDLLRYVPTLQEAGITEVFNALDMDRLTNSNVRNGSDKLAHVLWKNNIHFVDMFWGVRYATSKLTALSLVAKIRKVPYLTTGSNVFEQLRNVASALDNAGISTCTYKDESGNSVTLHWDPETKGIDDYLLHFG